MQGYVSDEVALDWIIDLSMRARYTSLHFEIPNWSDPTASEFADPGYARVPITWDYLSNRSIGNSNLLRYSISLASTAVAIGFHYELTDDALVAYATTPTGGVITAMAHNFVEIGRGMVVLSFA